MKSIVIPLEFLKAIGEKPHAIRIYWIKWLADYSTELFRNDFIEFFVNDMKGKNINLETIKEAYYFGMKFFEGGFTFVEENKKKRTTKKYPEETTTLINKVLDYLNEKTNSTYSATKTNSELIYARIMEGYSISDFKKVIDIKAEQWIGTEQEKYLRPITLFQVSKFENYLNEPQKQLNGNTKQQSSINKLSNASIKAKQLFS
jgi:uncharacterized phage protein (TIGR02220 family)